MDIDIEFQYFDCDANDIEDDDDFIENWVEIQRSKQLDLMRDIVQCFDQLFYRSCCTIL